LNTHLVFNLPKFSHITPILRWLQWLPVEARIYYKTMVLAYGVARGTAPTFRLCSNPTSQPEHSGGHLLLSPVKVISVLAPQWWNQLPPDARKAESLPIFPKTSETIAL
jgi:hypothetical protein